MAKTDKNDKILTTAKERFKQVVSVQGDNRDEALVDLKMLIGGEEQWDKAARDARKGRPMLTINKLPKFLKQVTGDQRQNRPSIKVRPVDSKADIQIAEIFEGFIRNIEYQSNAPLAYDTAFKFCVAAGFPGYWRVLTDYTDDDTFEQDIRIEPIRNALSVYMDHNCVPYRGQERYAFVCEMVPEEEFKVQWPKAAQTDFEADSRDDGDTNWYAEKQIRVAEYFYRETTKKLIYQLESGEVVEGDKVKAAVIEQGGQKFLQVGQTPEMGVQFVRIVKERTADSYKIMWCKMTGAEVLEGPQEWPGRFIPIIPVFPEEFILEGKTYWKGLLRDARDSQRLYNYTASANVEAIALSPKSPFLLTTQMIQGHEAQWKNAHQLPFPYLLVNENANGLPRRAEPVMQQPGLIQTLIHANDDMKDTTGIYDSMLGAQSNETSGRAIMARQKEGDTGTFEYHDNLTRAIEHTGRILVDLIPRIYDTQREIRLLNPDSTESFAPINKTVQGPNGEPILINDITVGKYDVAVTVGPAYATQRQEAAEALTQIMQAVAPAAPMSIPIILPRLFRMMDWPEADEIAEELQQVFQQAMQPQPQMPPPGGMPPGMPQGGMQGPPQGGMPGQGGGMPPEVMAAMAAGVPGRAAGGPVSGGQPYVVGERGPELVIPDQNASVIPADDTSRIMQVLQSNKGKNFVQRVLDKDNWPVLDQGNGNYATHKMSYAGIDGGRAVVYPNVVYAPTANRLMELSPEDAYHYAMKSGEHIVMPSEQDADWFTNNYKKVWDR